MEKALKNKDYIILSLSNTKEINKLYRISEKSLENKTRYKRNLNKKRELKSYYNLSINKINPDKNNWNNITNSIISLESRLDICLVRMNLSNSINESRQQIKRGNIYLNDKKIKSPSILLRKGDIITIKDMLPLTKREIYFVNKVPNYLEVNYNNLTGIYIRKPQIEELPLPFIV